MIANRTINLLAQMNRVEVERRLELAARPEGWAALAMIVVAAALCWAIVWMYRREGRAGASLRLRLIMASLRCLVMLALLGIWLEPVLATYLHRLIDSYTLVLVDTSSSMDLSDQYRDAETIDRVRNVIGDKATSAVRRTEIADKIIGNNDNALLRELAGNNRVQVYTFAESPCSVLTIRAKREERFREVGGKAQDSNEPLVTASDADQSQLDVQAHGAATDLGRAVRESVESLGRSPVAGVVVLTDGGINQGDTAQAIARYVQDRDVPLHIVGIGDPAPPRNIRVSEIVAPENVFAEDPFAIITQIAAQGMAGTQVTVELIERRADGGDAGRTIATQTVRGGPDNSVEPVTFQHRQASVGRYLYQVKASTTEPESVADDNLRQITVNVVDNKLRVLLVSGAPSWEYRYLSRLLQRDQTFEVSCWLQSADVDAVRDGDVVIDHLPATAEELFAFDAFILLDPDSIEFTADWCELLSRMVSEHGSGLLFQAARLNTPAFMRDAATQDLVRLLPVTPDPDADLLLNDIGHYQQQPAPLEVDPAALGHPVLKLPVGDERAPVSWSGIGQVYWYYPVLRAKPVATVLMRNGDPRAQNAYGSHVLLATQYVGAGRTAFLGFDGTWRWRASGEVVFDKFWVQMIRYLVEGKLAGGNRRGMLLTERDSYQLGEAVTVSARLFDESFEPLELDSVEAAYRIEDQTGTFTLERLRDRPGWYEGRLAAPRTGSCTLSMQIPGSELADNVIRREIQIVRPNLEILDPRMRREALKALAAQSPGGDYYDVDQAETLPAVIPDRHESTTIRSRPVPLWDDDWVLATLVALLCIEWTMRKVFRLL